MAKLNGLKLPSMADLRKKYKSANLANIVVFPKDKTIWLPCKSLAINYLLGGGILYGKIMELAGFESTGKTLLATDFAQVTQSLGGVILWGDAERSFSISWAEENGIDASKVELYSDNAIEPLSDWVRDMVLYYRSILTNNEPILLIIDSIAALECEDNIDSDQAGGKAEMGNRAKAIYKFWRKRYSHLEKYGVCTIAINQVREKVGASLYEQAETTPGGAATKFYASQRMMLVRSKQILDGDTKVGQNIIVKVNKNKVAPPKAQIRTEVHFLPNVWGYIGYSRYAGLAEILLEEQIIKKKGNSLYYKDKLIARGTDHLLKVLHKEEELRGKLIRKSSVNTISKTRKVMEAIDVNLYPVKIKKETEDE